MTGETLENVSANKYQQVPNGDDGDLVTQVSPTAKSMRPPKGVATMPTKGQSGITAPPSSGKIKWNHATQNLATNLFLSTIDSVGTDVSNFLALVKVGDAIYLQNQSDSNEVQRWDIISITNETGYVNYGVAMLSSSGGNFSTTGQGQPLILGIISEGGEVAQAFTPKGIIKVIISGDITKHFTQADTVNGDIMLALPDPTTLPEGRVREVIRVTTATNVLSVVGHINGIAAQTYVIGHVGEYMKFKNLGNTWALIPYSMETSAVLRRTTPSTAFSLTTGFLPYTDWESSNFSTLGKLVANVGLNKIDFLDFRSPLAKLRVDLNVNLEFTNNKIVFAEVRLGAAVLVKSEINSQGNNKPVTLEMGSLPVNVTANGAIKLFLKGEMAGSFTVIDNNMTIEKVGI